MAPAIVFLLSGSPAIHHPPGKGTLPMFGLTRLTVLIAATVISAIFAGITVGIAQSPSPPANAPPSPLPDPSAPAPSVSGPTTDLLLPQLRLPQVPLPQITPFEDADPAVRKHISDIIQRVKPVTETGDAELDDLGQALGGIQSILDGSQLDPSLDLDVERQDSQESRRAGAAELLLKTARKLEKLVPADGSRRQLVIQMRGEAAKLLSQ